MEGRTELLAMLATLPPRGSGDTFSLLRGRAGESDGAPGYARHAPKTWQGRHFFTPEGSRWRVGRSFRLCVPRSQNVAVAVALQIRTEPQAMRDRLRNVAGATLSHSCGVAVEGRTEPQAMRDRLRNVAGATLSHS